MSHETDILVVGSGIAGLTFALEAAAHGGVLLVTKRGLELGREGGHSRRRIVHRGDSTGASIEMALLARATAHPNVTILPDHFAVDLILEPATARVGGSGAPAACRGAWVLDSRAGSIL